MNNGDKTAFFKAAFEQGGGIVRLAPNWVPRSFCVPGRRLRLHPADLYALGAQRGGIDERWFASTIAADNGPGTPHDEGMSYIVHNRQQGTLAEAMGVMGADIIGRDAIDQYGGWVMYAKFFDNRYPLPHHLHHSDERAADIGRKGKPEAYYYPAQYNASLGEYPYTFFGLNPGTTQDQVIDCLKRWDEGDNGILNLSHAHRLQIGTGWDIAPGILHAPGTLCTYEPQRASDVSSMWQSLVFDQQVLAWELCVKDVPDGKKKDYDYLLSLLDWEANIDPDFVATHQTLPRAAGDAATMDDAGYQETWIAYGSEWYSAKELTVQPGRSVTIRDAGAYGLICIQGYGVLGAHPIAAPTMIRFGQLTDDEFFVSRQAATEGVQIVNHSQTEPLVILKHFNPGNPEMPARA